MRENVTIVVHKWSLYGEAATRCGRDPRYILIDTRLPHGKGYTARWCRRCVR